MPAYVYTCVCALRKALVHTLYKARYAESEVTCENIRQLIFDSSNYRVNPLIESPLGVYFVMCSKVSAMYTCRTYNLHICREDSLTRNMGKHERSFARVKKMEKKKK